MALIEDLRSVKHTEHKDGRSIVRTFTGTHDDYYNSPNMPRIGHRCSWDASVNVIETHFEPTGTFTDVTNISTYDGQITVVYTQWDTYGRIRADEAASWEMWFTSALLTHSVAQYYNYSSGSNDIWKTVYQAVSGNEALEEPELLQNSVETEFHVIAYGSQDRPKLMMDVLGTVNNSPFIFFLFTSFRDALAQLGYATNIPNTDALSIDDTAGAWLCAQADIQPLSTKIFMFEFTFVWSGLVDIWNTPYGITTNHYNPVDFKQLFTEISGSTFNNNFIPLL